METLEMTSTYFSSRRCYSLGNLSVFLPGSFSILSFKVQFQVEMFTILGKCLLLSIFQAFRDLIQSWLLVEFLCHLNAVAKLVAVSSIDSQAQWDITLQKHHKNPIK